MKKKDYQQQARDLGIEFSESTTVKELQRLISENQNTMKVHGQIEDEKIYIGQSFLMGDTFDVQGTPYKALSETVLRNKITGEQFNVEML